MQTGGLIGKIQDRPLLRRFIKPMRSYQDMPAHGIDVEERTHEVKAEDRLSEAFLFGLLGKKAEYAPGIPVKGEMRPIPSIKKPETWTFGEQVHHALRAGRHSDVRLSDGTTAFSWAVRKGLPAPGQKFLAVRQSDHAPRYVKWAGTIADKYGRGKVVLKRSGNAKIESASGTKINFAFLDSKNPQQYSLIKSPKYGDNRWLLLNRTPTESSRTDIPLGKLKTRDASSGDLAQYLSDRYILSSKIDGASVIVNLGDKAEVFSHRPSVSGELIDHTYVVGADEVAVPAALKGTKLRAEVFGVKNDRPIPLAALGGLLNSAPEKALRQMKQEKIRLYVAPFKVLTHNGKDYDDAPYGDHLKILGDVVRKLPSNWILPDTARTQSQKEKMLSLVREGKHPLTSEGVVAWPANETSATPDKIKFREHYQAYIAEIFPMVSGGKTVNLAGGFAYSLEPGGKIVGRVGTGLTLGLRKEMWDNRKDMVGRKVVVKSAEQLPSGAFRAPSFESFHL